MPTFLVPVAGSPTDRLVLETAVTLARAASAHLELLHIQIGPAEAARHMPHIGYARGQGTSNALEDIKRGAQERTSRARDNMAAACAEWGVTLVDKPGAAKAPTARWRIEEGDALERMVARARHNDFVLAGRMTKLDGLPARRLETLLLQSGRPIVIPGSTRALSTLGTVMVCWKESAEAARALGASLPFLAQAKRVVAVSIEDREGAARADLDDLAEQLSWNGISIEPRAVVRGARATQDVLLQTAQEVQPDLLVMGGYGRSPMAEVLFGGCTQRILEAADMTVLMMH